MTPSETLYNYVVNPPRQRDYKREWLIGELIYDLQFKRSLPCNDYGLCSDDGVIEISQRKNKNGKERLKTFIHEMMHAIEFAYEIEIDHDTIEKLEEPICNFILDNF